MQNQRKVQNKFGALGKQRYSLARAAGASPLEPSLARQARKEEKDKIPGDLT